MDIDIYQQCPCHAEKKIKFCCGKSVVADLDGALAKSKAGQTSSALEQLERTIAKTGPKDCLITIQTRLLLQAGELEKARAANAIFQQNNPEHSSGFHHLALICAQEGDPAAAVEALQDAMDAIVGNSIPVTYAQAFRMIGMQFLQQNNLFAARAHLRFADLLKEEPETKQILLSTFQNVASVTAKTEMMPELCPEDVPWGKKYKNVLRAIDRGQFRKALKMAKKADAAFADVGTIKRTLAIINSMLGYTDDAVDAWQSFADHEEDNSWDQINALTIKQFMDRGNEKNSDVVRHTFEVNDFDAVKELTASSDQLSPANRPDEDPFGESNPPVVGYYLLSKPKLKAGAEDFSLEDVPFMRGEVLLYAKQTDRAARAEYIVPKTQSYDENLEILKKILGEFHQPPKISVIDSIPELDAMMSWDWVLPEETSFEKHASLMKQQIRNRLVDTWMNYPLRSLGEISARDAAKDAALRPAIQALLTDLEHNSHRGMYPEDVIGEMRSELGIDKLPAVDLPDRDVEATFTLMRANLDFQKCEESKLFQIHEFGMMVRCLPIISRTCHAMLQRTSIEDKIQKDRIYAVLASINEDTDVVLDYLAKAKQEAKTAGRSIGTFLVQEFEFRLSRGMHENLRELIRTIQSRHLDEPEVEYRLTEVLMKYGLYDPTMAEGAPKVPPPRSNSGSFQTAQSVPAPSGEEGADAAAGSLWVPE
jgi:tetratricopeptide (TPR) repeat protein